MIAKNKKSTFNFNKWFMAQYGYGRLPTSEELGDAEREVCGIQQTLDVAKHRLMLLQNCQMRYNAALNAYQATLTHSKEFTKKVRK